MHFHSVKSFERNKINFPKDFCGTLYRLMDEGNYKIGEINRVYNRLEILGLLPKDYQEFSRIIHELRERVKRLKREGKHQSVIDASYYAVFYNNETLGKEKFDEIRQRKSTKVSAWMKDNTEFMSQKSKENWASKTPLEIRQCSVRCKEYWMKKGYSEEEAIIEVSKRQARGLEHFIKVYGSDGLTKWEERQYKWQNTLNSKPKEEIDRINRAKSRRDFVENCKTYGYDVAVNMEFGNQCRNYDELVETISKLIENSPTLWYKPPKEVLYKLRFYIYGWCLLDEENELLKIIEKEQSKYEKICEPLKIEKQTDSRWTLYVTPKGNLLRSEGEVKIWGILKILGLEENKDFLIEKQYPNSRLKCDFYIIRTKTFIEYAGLWNFQDEYDDYNLKMHYKHDKFGAVIIMPEDDPKEIISELL